MSTILLTGAAGRIGTILRNHWQGQHRIIGVDMKPWEPREGEVAIEARIESTDLSKAFDLAGAGAVVIHLAAATWDNAGWEDIKQSNIGGTYNVFRLAQERNAARVVFASTNHVTGGYGDLAPGERTEPYTPPQMLITPEMPTRPDSLYGVSKASGESLAWFFQGEYGLSALCLRIGSVTEHDDPTENPRLRSTWLSHHDLCHLFDCCLTSTVSFGIYYGVSRNAKRFWDISNAERELGYQPRDDAEEWYKKGEM